MFFRGLFLSALVLISLSFSRFAHAECSRPVVIVRDNPVCTSAPLGFSISSCINNPDWCRRTVPKLDQGLFLFKDGTGKVFLGDAAGSVWATNDSGIIMPKIPNYQITQFKGENTNPVVWVKTDKDPDLKVTGWVHLVGTVTPDIRDGKARPSPTTTPSPPTPNPPSTTPPTHGGTEPAPRRTEAPAPSIDDLVTKLKAADASTDKDKIWKWGSDLLDQVEKSKAKEVASSLSDPAKSILESQIKARWETPAKDLVALALKNESSKEGRAAKEEFERRRDKDPQVQFLETPKGNFPQRPEDAVISAELIHDSDKSAAKELGELMGIIDKGKQLEALRTNVKAKLDSLNDSDPHNIDYKRINWAATFVATGAWPPAATDDFKKEFETAYNDKLAANKKYHEDRAKIAAEKDAAKRNSMVAELEKTYGENAGSFVEFNSGGSNPNDRRAAETLLTFGKADSKGNLGATFDAKSVGYKGTDPTQTLHFGKTSDSADDLLQKAKAAAVAFNNPVNGESSEPDGNQRFHRFAARRGDLAFDKSKHFAVKGGKLEKIGDQGELEKFDFEKQPVTGEATVTQSNPTTTNSSPEIAKTIANLQTIATDTAQNATKRSKRGLLALKVLLLPTFVL